MKPSINLVFGDWHKSLAVIFIAALLVRGAFVLTLQEGFYFPDSVKYSEAAVSLLTDGEFGRDYNRSPAYPVFLAGIYVLFGENVLAVRMAESVTGAFLAVIVALIARRIGGEVVGALAGILWSIYPIGVFIAGLVYPTNLLTTLLACGVLCLVPHSHQELSSRRVFLAGLLLGLAALTKPTVLAAITVIGLWLAWWGPRKPVLLVLLLFVGSALPLAPWMLRNFYVHGRIVPIEPRLVQLLPRMSSAQENGVSKIEGILRHPIRFAAHFTGEFLHFWKPYPDRLKMNSLEYREKQHSKDHRVIKNTVFTTNGLVKAVSILSTAPLFFLAIIGSVGMCFQRERWRDLSLLWAIILCFAVVYSIFWAQMRYRIPIEPYITILSAYGLRRTWYVLAMYLAYGPSDREALESQMEPSRSHKSARN